MTARSAFGRDVLCGIEARCFSRSLKSKLFRYQRKGARFVGPCRQLLQAVGSEALFLRMYGPRFRSILQAVSEVVYAANGVSESEVSITLHK